MEHNRWRLYLKILAWLVALVYFALVVGRMLDLWISGAWFGGRAFQVCGVWLAMLGSVIFSLVFWYLEEILVTSDAGQNARKTEHIFRLALLGTAAAVHLILHLCGEQIRM